MRIFPQPAEHVRSSLPGWRASVCSDTDPRLPHKVRYGSAGFRRKLTQCLQLIVIELDRGADHTHVIIISYLMVACPLPAISTEVCTEASNIKTKCAVTPPFSKIAKWI